MRLIVAIVTSALVFVLIYLAAWRANPATPSHGFVWLQGDLHGMREALAEYARKNGTYPESLVELARRGKEYDLAIQTDESGCPLDPWRNPYQYSRTEGGYRLYSFGPDGEPGGVGIDADIDSERPDVTLGKATLRQFLFEAEGTGVVFPIALMASVCAGLIWYVSASRRQTRAALTASAVAVTVSAVVVAWFLAILYVAGSQSGH